MPFGTYSELLNAKPFRTWHTSPNFFHSTIRYSSKSLMISFTPASMLL